MADLSRISDPEARKFAQLNKFELTQFINPEDRAVLQECQRKSFYYGFLPLAFGSGIFLQVAIKQKRITPHPTMGSFPMLFGAGVMSYFIGQLMYRDECTAMLMREPRSVLGWRIKLARGLLTPEEAANPPIDRTLLQTVGPHVPAPRPVADYRPADVRDLDASRTGHSYSDPGHQERPLLDLSPSSRSNATPEEDAVHQQGRTRSFEDLRRENRSEYMNKIYRPEPARAPVPAPQRSADREESPLSDYERETQPPAREDYSPGRRMQQRTNKYGDPIEA